MHKLSQFTPQKYLIQSRNLFVLKTGQPNTKSNPIICPMIPGDGIGQELMDSVKEVFKAMSLPVKFIVHKISGDDQEAIGKAMNSVLQYGVCLKTPFQRNLPTYDDFPNLDVKLRTGLDLYASVAHIKSLPGVKVRHDNIDFYVIREQTESAYMNIEHQIIKGVTESLNIVTTTKSRRIAKFAFDFATRFQRKTVLCVHKANIMKLADGLFLKCCQEISQLYPKIELRSMIIDNCTMQLVSKPKQFDVIVTLNLYGNIIDNLSVGLVGGAGVVPGAEYSNYCVVFEPSAHHIAKPLAGKNVSNPTAMLLCAAKMLRHVNLRNACAQIKDGVFKVLREGKVHTQDIGGAASTTEFTDAVIDTIKKGSNT